MGPSIIHFSMASPTVIASMGPSFIYSSLDSLVSCPSPSTHPPLDPPPQPVYGAWLHLPRGRHYATVMFCFFVFWFCLNVWPSFLVCFIIFTRVLINLVVPSYLYSLFSSFSLSEWMRHLCSALLCTAVHPNHFPTIERVSLTVHQRQCTYHTPAIGGEEREIQPIQWMGIIFRRPTLIRASRGNLARTPGLHTLYEKCQVPF